MYSIVKYPHTSLTTPTTEFDFSNPPISSYDLVNDMLTIMIDSKGIGLSANQLGLPYRMFVMRGDEYNFACFNPKIVSKSDETTILEEGCLSFPGLIVKIARSNTVRLRFRTASGGTDTKTFDGLSARVIQHEINHLDGELFYNSAHRYHREKAFKRYNHGRA
jgi:peptide deformylase